MISKDNSQYNGEMRPWVAVGLLEKFFRRKRNGKVNLEIADALKQFEWFNYPQQNIIYGDELAEKTRTYLNNKEILIENGYKQDRR